MGIQRIIQTRYAVKHFNPDKKIPADVFAQIQAALRLSPSSFNMQPWHFVNADDAAGKARVAKATAGRFSVNAERVTNASHVVVFAAFAHAAEAHLHAVLAQEEQDGRFRRPESKQARDNSRRSFLNWRRDTLQDETAWLAKQVYLNMGFTLMAAAVLGVDALPMEMDTAVLDQEFGFPEQGYAAVAAIAFGYRAADDFNAALPTSRFGADAVFTRA